MAQAAGGKAVCWEPGAFGLHSRFVMDWLDRAIPALIVLVLLAWALFGAVLFGLAKL